ncbi:MAG TPA: sigma-70 family RNA polymerase sigma factor [Planctomycetota bacterium]|nr:sigma-70 family RNA polymerase sigma factor [Planctomycetota bacterium]
MVGLGSDGGTGGLRSAFPSTLWTVVLRAKDAASPERRQALETLIQLYWKPLYHFVRRRGNDPEKSADLVQSFFTALLERDALRSVDRSLGRFRTFLLTAFTNFVTDEYDRSIALKRGGGARLLSLDYSSAEAEVLEASVEGTPPEQVYTREWALRVLGHALGLLQQDYESAENLAEFDAFRRHLSYGDTPRPSYEEMGRSLGVSESVVRNRLHEARKRYADAILRVIRSYTKTEEDAQEELRDLFKAFS